MKTLQKIVEKIVNVLMVIVIIAILFCIYSIVSLKVFHRDYINIFGYSVFEVATGSMAKEINIHDAVVVKINDEYNVGDVVTYKSGKDFITHRVVTVDKDFIITKGDANNVSDNPIDKSLVLGRVIKVLPEFGVWKQVLMTPKVIILVLITLFIFSLLFSYNGKSIKIVSAEKSDDEINKRVEEEVSKKLSSMKRRKRAAKKVLDATQIINISDIKDKLNSNEKKKLEATQIIDTNKIKEKINVKNKKTLDATQIIDLNEVKKVVDNDISKKNKKKLEATQIIDISEIVKKK